MAFFNDPQAPDAHPNSLNPADPIDPAGSNTPWPQSPTVPSRDPNGNLIGNGPGQVPSTQASGNPMDRAWVISQIQAKAKQMQAAGQYVNPSVLNDPGYWADQVIAKGGWQNGGPNADNIGYFSSRFGQPEGAPQGGGAAGMGGMGGDLLQPFNERFSAPSGTDDPGFQFAVQQGQQGIERSAAAKGTLLTGGTLKDLASYTTGAALQDYAGSYNRALSTFGTNYDIFRNNQNDPFDKLYKTTGLGLDAVNHYSDSLDKNTSFYRDATDPTNFTNLTIDKGNINGQNAINRGNTLGNYAAIGGNLVNGWFNRPKPTSTYNAGGLSS